MEKTVKIAVDTSKIDTKISHENVVSRAYSVELTESQLRQALKEIEEKEKYKGWENSYEDGSTFFQNVFEQTDKEFLWPTKKMALAARKLCKAMWEYEFDNCDYSSLARACANLNALADEQD